MILKGAYTQEITHWAETALDGFGNRAYASPVLLLGRWSDRTDLAIEFEGETKLSKAVVYLLIDVALGGFLALGDHTATLDPTSLTDAYIIKVFAKIPNLRGTEFIRKVMV